jgi:hypothetical protein
LSYKAPSSGADVILKDIQVSVRGHTSREETECTFPKLKSITNHGNPGGFIGTLTSRGFGGPSVILGTRRVDMGMGISF